MEDQELKPLFTTRIVSSTTLRPTLRTKAMWFAKDSVNNRQPAQAAETNIANMQNNSLSDDDDPLVDKVATTLNNTREIPLSRPSSPTPAATPDHTTNPPPTTHSHASITIPVMMHKCRPMFRNGTSRAFGKVLSMQPSEITLRPTTTWDEFYREISNQLIKRFGDEVKISSLEDHACLWKVMVEHGRDSIMEVVKEGWGEMLESVRIEVLFGRRIVLDLWVAGFVEFERVEGRWWRRWWRRLLCCGK